MTCRREFLYDLDGAKPRVAQTRAHDGHGCVVLQVCRETGNALRQGPKVQANGVLIIDCRPSQHTLFTAGLCGVGRLVVLLWAVTGPFDNEDAV